MTRRWNVKVAVYPDRRALQNDQPIRTVEVPVENEHQHAAMAEAEMEVQELLEGIEGREYEVAAVGVATLDEKESW